MRTSAVAGAQGIRRFLVTSLMFIALVVAVVGSLGAPLITSVAASYRVPLSSAQWTLTITLLAGAIATPVLGRLGSGRRRRAVILWALAVIVAGSVATVLPLRFGWLLAGRAAQGVALGLPALMMGVARDQVPGAKSGSVIAMLSVASTVGVGLGYPLAGLLTDAGGVHAAYALGLFITVLLPGSRAHRDPPHQRNGPAAARRTVLRRHDRAGAPAAAGPGHRDRDDLLPLRQGVHAVGAVAAGDLASGRSAAARRHRQECPGHGPEPQCGRGPTFSSGSAA